MISGLKKLKGKGAGGAVRSVNTAPQLVSSSVNRTSSQRALPSVIHNNKSLHVKKGGPLFRF